MSGEKSASEVAIQLLQEAYDEVEAKNYSAALQCCQAALAIYQKIGDRTGVGYTLATITDICRLSLESLLPESDSRPDIESRKRFSLSLEPDSESELEPPPHPSPEKDTNRLRIKIEKGVSDLGKPPLPSRLIIEIDLPIRRPVEGVSEPPPTPTPMPPPRRSRLVIELTELEPLSRPSPSP